MREKKRGGEIERIREAEKEEKIKGDAAPRVHPLLGHHTRLVSVGAGMELWRFWTWSRTQLMSGLSWGLGTIMELSRTCRPWE